MIISHKYRFIFIKTYKTAGTSIEAFLSPHCSPDDILTPIYPKVDGHVPRNWKKAFNPLPEVIYSRQGIVKAAKAFYRRHKFYNHIPAKVVMSRIPRKIWGSYFKFCVERDPWDKTLSHYYMLNQRENGNLSLDKYFERGRFCLNYHLYTGNNGKLLVDKVVKYENLNNELSGIFNNVNVPFPNGLGIRAKSKSRSDRRPYFEVMSVQQQQVIEEVFRDEILLHGYTRQIR